MALQNWTLDQIINQLDSGTKWNVAPGGTITWGTPSTSNYYDSEWWYHEGTYYYNNEIYGLEKLNAAQTAVAARSLSLWSDVANINFVRVGTNQPADITFQNSTEMGDAYAWAYYPSDENNSMKSSIWFNSYYPSLQSPNLNGDAASWGNLAFIHEIGHALGLEHMGNYDAGTGENITYKTHASCVEDSLLYSIMSYFTPEEAGQADWRASDGRMYYCQTPMMNDIAAIQALYGKKATRESDTVYGFNASGGLNSVYNFNINKHPVLCIYDTGGIDTLDLSGFSSNSSVNLQPGTFSSCDMMTKNISIARDVIIENARTGRGNDTILGNDAANSLHGGAGNDTLSGGLGNDVLNGGSGIDSLSGGTGDDTFHIDNSRDRIVENIGEGTDMVLSSVTVTAIMIGAHVENISLTGNAAINATGNASANTINGNAMANTLNGGAGDDILNGGRGNDRLFGGTENDTLNGGSGNDLLDGGTGADSLTGGAGNDIFVFDDANDLAVEVTGQGTDTIQSWVNLTLSSNIENINLLGSAINATGNELANVITGNANANVLDGGLGRDTLIGGAGADIFVFSTILSSANIDTVRDFSVKDDTIHLDDVVFANLTADFFSISTRALDADDRIIYNARTGALSYDADGNGSIAAIQFATLSKNLALTSADFVII